MPYSIKKYKDGWRVYTRTGTALSHKPLSLAQATKQKTAVIINERRGMRGGGEGGDESYSLSDSDIQRIVGGTNIIRYPDLHNMSSIEEAFDDVGRCIMLYLTENEDTGHWVCLLKKGDTIEYFDPYGGYKPDGERHWLSKEKREELGEDDMTLTKMLKGYKVISNPYHFQKEVNNVNTCGRHCCVRALLGHLNLSEYNKMIKDSGLSPDEFVTTYTSQVLKK